MAGSPLPVTKLLGIALVVLGAGLIIWGYQLSDSVAAQLTETVSGAMPDEVMMRYIGGAVAVAVGLALALRG